MGLVQHLIIELKKDYKELLLEVSKGKRKAIQNKIADMVIDNGRRLLTMEIKKIISEHPDIMDTMMEYIDSGEYFRHNSHKFDSELDLKINKMYDEVNFRSENIKDHYFELSLALGIICIVYKSLEAQDPTPNGKYMNWLLDIYFKYTFERGAFGASNQTLKELYYKFSLIFEEGSRYYASTYAEDLEKIRGYLELYDDYKRRNLLPDKYKDINSIKGDQQKPKDELYDVIKPIYQKEMAFKGDVFELIDKELIEGEDYKDYGIYNGFHIYEPLTGKAQSYMGANTEWCTTYGEHCLYDDYKSRSQYKYDNLYILININDDQEKYQFHFSTEQFMDKNDSGINLSRFLNEHDDIHKFFMKKFGVESYSIKELLDKAP